MTKLLLKSGNLYSFSISESNEDENTASKTKQKNKIIQVLLADDHPYLINGIIEDLSKDSKIKIADTVNSYDELLGQARALSPDIVLLDLKMPEHRNRDLEYYIKHLRKLKCKIIIFSNETGWARIHKCLEYGASGYIEKAISLGRLSELIYRICSEDELIVFTTEEFPQIEFSQRQKEIMHYLADGKENNEISILLEIDLKTVQSYINQVKSKLSTALGIYPIKPRTLCLLASKLGFSQRAI